MQASNSNDRIQIPTWAKILYLLFVALVALIAYRVGSIWFGHIVVILFLLPLTWTFAPRSRRLVRFLFVYIVLTTLLATAFFLFLNDPYRSAAIEDAGLLNFLIGGQAARVIVSIVTAVLLSALVLLGPILLLAWVSSEWILQMPDVYDISRWQAMRMLAGTMLNTTAAYFVVDEGEIKQSKPSGLLPRLGGPGMAVIKPYNAVVFERGGEITRIEGPGAYRTERFEMVKGIVDLRKQWLNFTAENVLTKDNVPLTFHCGVGFQIEPQWETARRVEAPGESREGRKFTGIIDGDYAVYRRTIYRAVYNTTAGGWRLSSQGATETQLRKIMRQYRLEDLYRLEDDQLKQDAPVINTIEEQVRDNTGTILHTWGATLSTFSIKSFEAPEDVKDRLLEMWAARYASRRQIIDAEGSRDADLTRWQAQEEITIREARADGQAELTRLMAETEKHIQLANAERLALESKAAGESQAIREKRRAESEVEAERIQAEAEARRRAAELRLDSARAEAQVKAWARRLEGDAEAQARAEMFRQILNVLYSRDEHPEIDERTISQIAENLATRVGLEEAMRYLAAVSGRRDKGLLSAGSDKSSEDASDDNPGEQAGPRS
ncbi:MAG: SPFH domain-containing protein [Anaerolineae bacterium]|jgi:regulator of protease activity HflC (stomatin/prohibitin superfamily)